MKPLFFAGLAIAFLGAGCMGSAPSNDVPPAANAPTPVKPAPVPTPSAPSGRIMMPEVKTISVEITDSAFSPKQLSINAGDTVVWTNKGKFDHTVTGVEGALLWDSGNLKPGKQFTHTFDAVGVYKYHCAIHPALMTGEILVGEVKANPNE